MNNVSTEKVKMNGSQKLISKDSVESLTDSVNEITHKVREVADNTVSKSIDFAKKYPVYTFIGALTLGFLSGMIVGSRRS